MLREAERALTLAAGIGMVWVDMGARAGRIHRLTLRGPLEADLVNDVEADKRGERQRDSDGEQIHVERETVGCAGECRSVVVLGCHKAPCCCSAWFGVLNKRKSPHIALCADTWAPEDL